MARISTRWIRVLGAGALVAGSIGLSASTSGATTPAPNSPNVLVGYLKLHLSSTGVSSVTRLAPDLTQVGSAQTISVSSKCAVTTNGSLLSIAVTGASKGVGLVGNGLGGRQKDTCGSAEGRFGGAEHLVVGLGSAFGASIKIDRAELDVEGKFNAVLKVVLDGGSSTSPLNLISDNGPDSGIGDNNRVVLDQLTSPFRSMDLSTTAGEASLEGGGDGTAAQYQAAGLIGSLGHDLGDTPDSIFRLVHTYSDALFCGQTLLSSGTGSSAESASVTRNDNDLGQPCEDVGATLTILDNGVLLDKGTTGINTGTPQAVNSTLDITWSPQAATLPLPATQINYAGNNGPFDSVQWCGPSVGGDWTHPAYTGTHSQLPAGTQVPWCLISQNSTLNADGTVTISEVYDGQGDPWLNR